MASRREASAVSSGSMGTPLQAGMGSIGWRPLPVPDQRDDEFRVRSRRDGHRFHPVHTERLVHETKPVGPHGKFQRGYRGYPQEAAPPPSPPETPAGPVSIHIRFPASEGREVLPCSRPSGEDEPEALSGGITAPGSGESTPTGRDAAGTAWEDSFGPTGE